jgi:hypothetical protein
MGCDNEYAMAFYDLLRLVEGESFESIFEEDVILSPLSKSLSHNFSLESALSKPKEHWKY